MESKKNVINQLTAYLLELAIYYQIPIGLLLYIRAKAMNRFLYTKKEFQMSEIDVRKQANS